MSQNTQYIIIGGDTYEKTNEKANVVFGRQCRHDGVNDAQTGFGRR